MRAGEKNRRIKIEVMSTAKSTFGSDAETWLLLKEVWAKQTFLPLKELEEHQGDQILSQGFVEFKIDYIPTISPKLNRVVYQGQFYDIWHITEVGYREAMLLKCRQIAIAGVGTGVGIPDSGYSPSPPPVPIFPDGECIGLLLCLTKSSNSPVPPINHAGECIGLMLTLTHSS